MLLVFMFAGCQEKRSGNESAEEKPHRVAMDGPGAFFHSCKLRYKIAGPDAVDSYLFEASTDNGLQVQYWGAGASGTMKFADSAIESGEGATVMSQGAVLTASNEYIDTDRPTPIEDSPPFLVSRRLFSELSSTGKTVLRYGVPTEIQVAERTKEEVLIDGAPTVVPAYRCIGEVVYEETPVYSLEVVIVDDLNWPLILRVEYTGLNLHAGASSFVRFEAAGTKLGFRGIDF